MGRKNVSRFRIVASDSRNARDGRFLEVLGYYNPQATPKEFKINTQRVAYWIQKGAVINDTIKTLLKQDRFYEKLEGIKKGLSEENLNLSRLPDRKKRVKNRKKEEAKEAK
jgi:small subunit ribosomal protein S16